MSYKIVGVDGVSDFPPRVETRLAEKFTGTQEFNSTVIDINQSISSVSELAEGSVQVPEFSLQDAKLKFGVSLRAPGTGSRAVMQTNAVDHSTGDIYYTQATPTPGATTEDTIITRCDNAGKYISQMRINQAGHGTSIYLERTSAGLFIWVQIRGVVSGEQWSIVRIPWADGVTIERSSALVNKLPVLDRGRVDFCYCPVNHEIGVIERNALNGNIIVSRHDPEALKAGRWEPIEPPIAHAETEDVIQGWALAAGTFYVYKGAESSAAPSSRARIYSIAKDGSVGETRYVNEIRQLAGGFNVGATEPEGISVVTDSLGSPAFLLGVSYGPNGARSQKLHVLSMADYHFDKAAPALENTGWLQRAITFASGIESDSRYPFSARVIDGNLELYGRVTGSALTGVGPIVIGQLRDGWVPRRQKMGIAAKSMNARSPGPFARVTVTSSGEIQLWPDYNNDGPFSWAEIAHMRVELSDLPQAGS